MRTDTIRDRIWNLIKQYWEQEQIRTNPPTRLLNNSFEVFTTIRDWKPTLLQSPLSVQIELTNQCCSRCSMCQRWTWENSDRTILTLSEIQDLLCDLAAMGIRTVTFSGGEPLLREDLPDILALANKYQIASGILTGGPRVPDSHLIAIARYAAWVRVSVDGSNRDTYAAVRGVDSFEEVQGFIERLGESITQSAAASRCRLSVSYTIQRGNIDDALNMMELVERWGCDGLTYKFAHGPGRYVCSLHQLAKLKDEMLRQEALVANRTNISFLNRFIEKYSTPSCIADGKPLRAFYSQNELLCVATYLFALVDAWGDVYPCCYLYHDNDDCNTNRSLSGAYRLGNISTCRFSELWRSKEYQAMRRSLSPIDIHDHPECAQCTRHFIQNAFLSDLYDLFLEAQRSDRDFEGSLFSRTLHELSDQSIAWL